MKVRDDLETYFFERIGEESPSEFAIAFWSGNGLKRAEIEWPEGLRVYDIMGNPLPRRPAAFLLSADVNYVIGSGEKLEAASQAIREMTTDKAIAAEGATDLDSKTGQYVYRVTVTNLLPQEPVKVQVGACSQRNFWEGMKALGTLAPGEKAEAEFGLNAYQRETDEPRPPGHFLYLEALGAASHRAIHFSQPLKSRPTNSCSSRMSSRKVSMSSARTSGLRPPTGSAACASGLTC